MKSLYQHMRHDLICKIGFVMIVGLAMTPVSGQTVDSITTPTTVLPQLVWPTSKQYGNSFIRVQLKYLPFGYPSAQLACESYFGPIASAQHTTRLSNTADYDCLINDPESGWRNTYYTVRQSASCPDHYRINGGYSAASGCSALGCPNTVCKLSGAAINTCPSVPENETPYQLDPGGLTCSRPDQCQPPDVIDPATGQCVHCSIEELSPLDPAMQPYEDGLVDMENATQAARDGAACIVRSARAHRPRINATLVSGYRPQAYQTHIREVYDKWQLLANNNDAKCADVKSQIKAEYDHHGPFAHQPGNTSRHSTGRAVDISLTNYADADTIAAGCVVTGGGAMSRPVANDRSHFESPR